jgi:peroxiredoxin
MCALWVPLEGAILSQGEPAPPFSLPSLQGDRIALRAYCGETLLKPYLNDTRHVVILSFWATYCKPCKKELPELISFAQAHARDSVVFFSICVDREGAQKARAYVQKHDLDMTVLIDRYKVTAERYGVEALPSLFVIGPYGTVRYSVSGYTEDSDIQKTLAQVLAGIRSTATPAVTPEARSIGNTTAIKEMHGTHGDETRQTPRISSYDKWKAVARVECGDSLALVARQLHVAPAVVTQWYNELKKAARALWEEETVDSAGGDTAGQETENE